MRMVFNTYKFWKFIDTAACTHDFKLDDIQDSVVERVCRLFR